jgi:peptidoglycan/LPS O-acetylase OafA/YrhL
MSYTVYVWHTFFYFVILEALGADAFLGQKWRAPVLAVIAIVASLPIYYGVEQRLLRVKLRFASEKEVLDLNTGKMMSVEAARAVGKGTFSAEAVEGPEEYSSEQYGPGGNSPDVDGQS